MRKTKTEKLAAQVEQLEKEISSIRPKAQAWDTLSESVIDELWKSDRLQDMVRDLVDEELDSLTISR